MKYSGFTVATKSGPLGPTFGEAKAVAPGLEAQLDRDLEAAARFPQVFLKVSALVESTGRRDGTAPRDVEFYRPWLDIAWNAFGPDRLIYGSDWPVSSADPLDGIHVAVMRSKLLSMLVAFHNLYQY